MHGCVLWKVATFLFHLFLFLIFFNPWEKLSIIYLLSLFDCSFDFYWNILGRLWEYRKRRRWPASCISYILYHIFDITYHISYIIYHISHIMLCIAENQAIIWPAVVFVKPQTPSRTSPLYTWQDARCDSDFLKVGGGTKWKKSTFWSTPSEFYCHSNI